MKPVKELVRTVLGVSAVAVTGAWLAVAGPADDTANAAPKLDQFGEGSVPASMTSHELADLFSRGAEGNERYYRYSADKNGNVPTDTAFCDVANKAAPEIIDVASQGAKGVYAVFASQDQLKPDSIEVNFDTRQCKAAGMTFGFGTK